jgi:hypothetical protein
VTVIKKDDWIRIPALWPGIWKVSRILEGFKEDRWSLSEPLKPSSRRIVFCHRIVNDSWQRSFSHQSCNESLVNVLPSADSEKLTAMLSSTPKLWTAFEKYRANTKSIDLIANLGFGELTEEGKENFRQICSRFLTERIQAGMNMDEVLTFLAESELASHRHKFPQQLTLQLISIDHEVRGDRFLYSKYRVLPS